MVRKKREVVCDRHGKGVAKMIVTVRSYSYSIWNQLTLLDSMYPQRQLSVTTISIDLNTTRGNLPAPTAAKIVESHSIHVEV